MSPVKPTANGLLGGRALELLSTPVSDTMRGGIDGAFDGSEGFAPPVPVAPDAASEFAGMGSWLEDDDATVFKTADNLVLRTELPAKNHLAQDIHYTRIKLGYAFSTLERDPERDTFRATLPTGTKALTIQAVPNKAWDLINKATETVLSDPAEPDPQPINDSEDAKAAADMASKFLAEDAGEMGTNDIALLTDAIDGALVCATKYIEGWIDPVGGGYVPLQILAHPQAVSPDNPLIGPPTQNPDGTTTPGMPTPNPVLRYVTAVTGGQFTTDPSQAAPEWQPKIRGTVWGREHWRLFPESAKVEHADKAIGLLYCTIGEAKKRWPTVAAMSQDQLNTLLNWTPQRYTVLLPPYQRARYKLAAGQENEKSGASDERILFYYRILQKAAPDHPKGAEVIVSGVNKGLILDRKLLAATLAVPTEDGSGTKQETRCMDLPLVAMTPRADPDERDPTGRAYIEMFCGAAEFNSALAAQFLALINQYLNPDSYIESTSSVQGFQVTESRATGDAIPIMPGGKPPTYGNQPPIPPSFWQSVDWNDKQIDSIASLNKPVTGGDSQEVSGVARKIAVQQAMIGLSRMQRPANNAKARWCRIKLQLAMRDYSTPQMIRYEGEDGAYKAVEWTGTDFALVGNVAIKAGTGTMMPPEAKVSYFQQLKDAGLLTPAEAAEGARPAFAAKLGLTDSPHAQYVERCTSLWLDGPPAGWLEMYQAYQAAMQQYQAAQQQAQAAQQQVAAQYQASVSAAQAAGQPVPPPPQAPPQAPPPASPWTPFLPKANDSEPAIAAIWVEKLSNIMSSVKYDQQPPLWRIPFDTKYTDARNAVAAAQAPPGLPHGVSVVAKTGASDVGQAEMAATHPQAAPPAPAPAPAPPPAPEPPAGPPPEDPRVGAMHEALQAHMAHGAQSMDATHALIAQLAQTIAATHGQPPQQHPPTNIHVAIPPHAMNRTITIHRNPDGSAVGHVHEEPHA